MKIQTKSWYKLKNKKIGEKIQIFKIKSGCKNLEKYIFGEKIHMLLKYFGAKIQIFQKK